MEETNYGLPPKTNYFFQAISKYELTVLLTLMAFTVFWHYYVLDTIPLWNWDSVGLHTKIYVCHKIDSLSINFIYLLYGIRFYIR